MSSKPARRPKRCAPLLAEIEFVLAFINTGGTNDYRLRSDSLREVFYRQHTIDGEPATEHSLEILEGEITAALEAIAAKRAPRLGKTTVDFAENDRRRRRRVVDSSDLSSRLRLGVQELIKARGAIRKCELCPFPFFFQPTSRERYCSRCKNSVIAIAEALERSEFRMKKSRAKAVAVKAAEYDGFAKRLEKLNKEQDRAQVRRDHALARRCGKLISQIEDSDRWKDLDTWATGRAKSTKPPAPLRRATEPVAVYVGNQFAYQMPFRTFADVLKVHRDNRTARQQR